MKEAWLDEAKTLLDKKVTLEGSTEEGRTIEATGHCVSVMAAVNADHSVLARYYVVTTALGQWYGTETWHVTKVEEMPDAGTEL